MTLGEKQEVFTAHLAMLITHMVSKGYGVRLKEVLRTKEQAEIYAAQGKGILNSNHRNGCAADMYFSKAGELLWSGEAYEIAASYWTKLSTPFTLIDLEHCWGGDFKRRDVYHYSIKHGGVI